MRSRIHALAGGIALLCILCFWTATVVSELMLSDAVVVAVKRGILYAMAVLIPALATTGASGFVLARNRSGRLLARKKQRMPFIAANGLLILVPAAFFLHTKAAAGEFDKLFYIVQAVELLVGAINVALMSLNLRDGLRLAGRLRFGAAQRG
jgi:hypothetical protein